MQDYKMKNNYKHLHTEYIRRDKKHLKIKNIRCGVIKF